MYIEYSNRNHFHVGMVQFIPKWTELAVVFEKGQSSKVYCSNKVSHKTGFTIYVWNVFKNIINILEGDQNYKICRIVGEKENVEEAKNLIIDFIDPKDSESLEMWVPQVNGLFNYYFSPCDIFCFVYCVRFFITWLFFRVLLALSLEDVVII